MLHLIWILAQDQEEEEEEEDEDGDEEDEEEEDDDNEEDEDDEKGEEKSLQKMEEQRSQGKVRAFLTRFFSTALFTLFLIMIFLWPFQSLQVKVTPGKMRIEDPVRREQEEKAEEKRLAIMMMKKKEKYLYNKIMFGKKRKIREVGSILLLIWMQFFLITLRSYPSYRHLHF